MMTSRKPRGGAAREFHVSRRAREAYEMPDALFGLSGNVVFADFHAARLFAHRMNERRDLLHHPERAVSASQIYALGLIDEVLHLVVARHLRLQSPDLWARTTERLRSTFGDEEIRRLLLSFVDEFPPSAVYRGEMTSNQYLDGSTDGMANAEVVLEELLLLWLANRNPAFAPYRELFDDHSLRRSTVYVKALETMERSLGREPAGSGGGHQGRTLLDLLYAPMRTAPDSLDGQLEFIRRVWAELLGPDLHRVLGGLDFLAEENRVVFPPGPGPIEVPDFEVLAESGQRYSADRDWMPRLVLLAKNAHVWLAQLSERYGRRISTLDGIPDEELARLEAWGFTGLWLIGIWERSRASERIKRMMGDEEAVASAYSLYDYSVADSLGGEGAYEDLRTRALHHGIRLSTDMVPNHMGIDSRWMIEHPHWFLWRDQPPFPTYSFDGPDLCDDERVGVYIEDHYWQRDDAAVVFKRVDHHTGEARFVYHGNDGTSMPWNDTAQLDYLNPEVREAVIQTILAVARRSPVIRFDAAMTLARQHYHRLWFPAPGAAGAIPSRAEYSLTRPEFDSAMPREFWREVVDRVAEEAPDTLLLAEAFWLLEGYFVRTLGMHRVYNSAFMNMLRDEKNDEYRKLIRSTLEFDPQILKRYVNFMSNPDERTAVDQFGTGDKYFGVATLLATMPGLPMLGHGQIEGLAEKYGMEFQRPRWDERPNEGLVWRHELQIFPLLRRRAIFAEVENFLLYDMVRGDSSVDENVFAYSNQVDGERSLVIYNNRYGETSGTLRLSTAVARRDEAGNTDLVLTALADGLGLPADDSWVVARDVVTGLEHLWSSRRLRDEGFPCNLGAYELHCFLDFKTVYADRDHPYDQLAERIGDRGVPSIDNALGQWVMAPVVEPLRRLTPPELLELLAAATSFAAAADDLRELAITEVARLAEAAAKRIATPEAAREVERSIHIDLEAALALGGVERTTDEAAVEKVPARLAPAPSTSEEWLLVIGWILVRHLGSLEKGGDPLERSRSLYEELYLRAAVGDRLHELGASQETAQRHAAIIDLLLAAEGWDGAFDDLDESFGKAVRGLLNTAGGQRRLGVNRYGGELWFNGEAFERLAAGLAMTAAVTAIRGGGAGVQDRLRSILECVERGRLAATESGYRLAKLLELLPGSDTGDLPER